MMRRAHRFLPDPLSVLHYLVDEAQGFSSRPDVGIERGLIARMISAFQGDPIVESVLTSTGPSNPVGLPNVSDSQSAVGYVSGADIYYRTDGNLPLAAGDSVIQEGATFNLTGTKTMTAFQFASAGPGVETVYIPFYT